jgi:hypothetical protein
MKGLLKKILLGDVTVAEYSTITIPGEIEQRVFFQYLHTTIDVSTIHWLLCLEPVVFGIWLTHGDVSVDPGKEKAATLYFTHAPGKNQEVAKKHAIATVSLQYVDQIDEAGGTLFLFASVESRIYHVNKLRTLLLFNKYYKNPKWPFDRYKSLIAAYSYPRRVRIISFKQGDYYNIFPMDLLGTIPGAGKQVFGLRHTNVTLGKIIETKKIVLSEVPYKYKDVIYQLGKHHGGSPPPLSALPFGIQTTDTFGFPVPEWAESYKEIELERTRDLGSHMLLWGNIANERIFRNSAGSLYHIHFLLHYHQKLKGNTYQLV